MRKFMIIASALTTALLARDYALIVGIANYQNMRGLSHISSDIETYKNILRKKGVAMDDVLTLRDNQATKWAITDYLNYVSKDIKISKNNRFFMFFAGHGISTEYLKYNNRLNQYLTKSGVILPYEYNSNNIENTIIIGKRDLKPYLTKIDKSVNESLVIFDACFAGDSIKGKLRIKRTPFIYSDVRDYPYNNIVYIASSTPKNRAKSGVLSQVLNQCMETNLNLNKLRWCMNDKVKYMGQRIVFKAK